MMSSWPQVQSSIIKYQNDAHTQQTITPNPPDLIRPTMVSLSQRMRKLQTKLLAIRLGPGALVLPKEVKRIHMRFGTKINGGHMGPRYRCFTPIPIDTVLLIT